MPGCPPLFFCCGGDGPDPKLGTNSGASRLKFCPQLCDMVKLQRLNYWMLS